MICPNCNGNTDPQLLTDINRDRLIIEKCDHCGGFWLEKGKLHLIGKNTEENLDSPTDENIPLPNFPLDCPKCHMPMERKNKEHFGKRDYWICNECHGTWLYEGQLFNYLHFQEQQALSQTDVSGTFTRRDRVLTAMTGIAVVTLYGALLFITRGNNLLKAAEIMKQPYDRFPWLWFLALIMTILIFSFGLSMALFKRKMVQKILGSATVVGALVMLIYLMGV